MSETFDDLSNQVYWKLYNKLERKDDPDLRFATNGTARGELNSELLVRFFRCLLVGRQTAVQQFGFTEEELAARVEDRKLHDFLAVLIFASCGINAARIFTNTLVASNEWPLFSRGGGSTERRRRGRHLIQSLPASREDLLYLFKDGVVVEKFCSSQACFSTVVILKRQEISIDSLASCRLPYLEENEIRSGSFGRVFRVKIAKGHFRDPKEETLNDEPKYLARKDYITTGAFDGEKERNIIESIIAGSSRQCENILGNYGSLRIGSDSYSLFMPCAICDLSIYMKEYHSTRPSTRLEKAEMVLSARGLADGLDFLHNEMKTPDQQNMVCYHMDLKPSNILVFRDTDTNHGNGMRYVWKLSDFGMARVKVRKRGQTVEREMDFNRSFHERPRRESLSGTRNLHGDGTYLPPESLAATRTMTTASDVWSLGCVLSVVFAYLEDGGEGVENYQHRRLQHADADGYDRFFLRGGSFRANREHPEVNKTHNHLIRQAANRQAEEAYAVEFMLKWLEERVLIMDPRKRASAKTVKEKLSNAYTLFNKMPSIEKPPGRGGPNPHSLLGRFRHLRSHSRGALLSNWQVGSWQLSAVEGLKGCEISSRGTTVAYWSDTKIRLFNELSVPSQTDSDEPPIMNSAAEYPLELTDCIWKCVALTDRYLIASTTGATFQCYIYDLILECQYRVTLQLPEITKLAISPDSETLLCIVQSKGEDCGFVFLFPIAKLLQETTKQTTLSTKDFSVDETESNPTSRGLPNDSTMLRLEWSADDITQISFPSPDEVYLIIQPRVTARSRENEIGIIHLSLQARPRLLQTVRVRSQEVDPGNTVGLFTTLTAFRQQHARCAFVVREKQLYIQNMADAQSIATQSLIKGYRVFKLVMDWNDKKMFALGTPSDTSRIYLLEMTVPQYKGDDITVKELLPLPDLSRDDEFTQMLSDPRQPGEKYFLIAALTTASRRWIYRISLSDSTAAS